jgi:hypothetical protein
VRDAVGNVAEQKLLAAAHAYVADHDHIYPFFLNGVENRLRRVDTDDHPRPPARSGEFLGESL